ncbi:GntR family transcriptional regulator [Acidobacteriota bacterium]
MKTAKKILQVPKTLSQTIYAHLKESIINNELEANERINEKEIAKSFGVSTTPVREAVLRLGADGYIKIDTHRRAVVAEISYQELLDLYQVMSILESAAVIDILDHIQSEQISRIEEKTEEMIKLSNSDSVELFLQLNVSIHNELWQSLSNRMLQKTLRFVDDQILRYNHARTLIFQSQKALDISRRDHKRLITLLKSRDKDKLAVLVRNHWNLLTLPSLKNERFQKYINTNGGDK